MLTFILYLLAFISFVAGAFATYRTEGTRPGFRVSLVCLGLAFFTLVYVLQSAQAL